MTEGEVERCAEAIREAGCEELRTPESIAGCEDLGVAGDAGEPPSEDSGPDAESQPDAGEDAQ